MTEPNMGDAYVFSKMEALEKVVKIHENLAKAGQNPPPFFPDEIALVVDFEELEDAWEGGNYHQVRALCAEGWWSVAANLSGEPPVYSAIDYAVGKATLD